MRCIVRTDYFEKKTMRYNDTEKVRIPEKEILYEMKRTVVAIVNSLVSEAVCMALKRIGFVTTKSFSQTTDAISKLCDTSFANLLLMDVTRVGAGTFEKRKETVIAVRKQNADVKIGLFCDNVSDEDVSFNVMHAKKEGLIDVFFYESVPSDYVADVLQAL